MSAHQINMKNKDLTDILSLFTKSDVPSWGPEEEEVDAPRWKIPEQEDDRSFPGGGLSRYPMVYIGEGCNKIFVVSGGKVIWTYSTGKGWEYDDVWMLSSGNILFSRMSWAGEVTPQKKLIWRRNAEPGTELHTIQPIGEDRALMMVNGRSPALMIVNTKTDRVEYEHAVPFDGDPGKNIHAQFRRVRITAANTLLVPYLTLGKVVEYDMDLKPVWSYEISSPWAAVRLNNGNTLITDEIDRLTREVAPDGKCVWQIRLDELPAEYRIPDSQSCVRLKNGNTILCSRGGSGSYPQLVEVTPQKEVVWVLKDWKDLGPASAVQILSDPGDPGQPGDCER